VQKDCTEKKPFGISRHVAKGLHHTEKAFGIQNMNAKGMHIKGKLLAFL
jgi:hypothetical protein